MVRRSVSPIPWRHAEHRCGCPPRRGQSRLQADGAAVRFQRSSAHKSKLKDRTTFMAHSQGKPVRPRRPDYAGRPQAFSQDERQLIGGSWWVQCRSRQML